MVGVKRALVQSGGIASVNDFRSYGIGRGAVRVAFAKGDVVRVRRGWYALSPTHPAAPYPSRVLAARVGGLLGCIDAAAIYGLWRPPGAEVHVSLFDHARHLKHPDTGVPIAGSSEGVAVHWDAPESLRYGDVVPLDQCLVQVLRCQAPEMALAVIESALHLGRIDGARAIEKLRAEIPSRGDILDDVQGSAESGTESLFRYRMARIGISMQSQVVIDGVGRVDFVIGDRLVIEVDSELNHGGRAKRLRDLDRDALLAGLGYICLRFDYTMIMNDWELVASTVFAVVSRGDHIGPRP